MLNAASDWKSASHFDFVGTGKLAPFLASATGAARFTPGRCWPSVVGTSGEFAGPGRKQQECRPPHGMPEGSAGELISIRSLAAGWQHR